MEEKKESWIEKVLSLLNEFETPKSWVVFKSYDDYDGTFYWVDCDGETEIAWSDSMILSKRFQFVEWLVDNDKIKDYYEWNEEIDYVREKYSEYESLLMLLSINDNPISFLISLLK